MAASRVLCIQKMQDLPGRCQSSVRIRKLAPHPHRKAREKVLNAQVGQALGLPTRILALPTHHRLILKVGPRLPLLHRNRLGGGRLLPGQSLRRQRARLTRRHGIGGPQQSFAARRVLAERRRIAQELCGAWTLPLVRKRDQRIERQKHALDRFRRQTRQRPGNRCERSGGVHTASVPPFSAGLPTGNPLRNTRVSLEDQSAPARSSAVPRGESYPRPSSAGRRIPIGGCVCRAPGSGG